MTTDAKGPKKRMPELAALHELPEFAHGMRALASASEPSPGFEARVLVRLEADAAFRSPHAGYARAWSLTAAAALLVCAFLGERIVEHRESHTAGSLIQRTSASAVAQSQGSPRQIAGGNKPVAGNQPGLATMQTADAQRATVAPVAVGRRQGRANRAPAVQDSTNSRGESRSGQAAVKP